MKLDIKLPVVYHASEHKGLAVAFRRARNILNNWIGTRSDGLYI